MFFSVTSFSLYSLSISSIFSRALIDKFIPSITWKDIFRLELNSEKEINGRNIHGPKLYLRGITNSQINTGHAFLIYLTFKLRQTRYIRNLEETTKIEAICEVVNEVEETKNDTNIVEYTFIWNEGGTSVKLVGSFNKWKEQN